MARGGHLPTIFNPEGVVITHDAYKALKAQTPDPYLIRQFQNEKVSLQLRHAESMHGARDVPKQFWKMFRIHIENIITTDSEGHPLDQPKRVLDPDSKDFIHKIDAETVYYKFLAKYTESHFDERTGELVEVGNVLTPPNPDKPTMSEESPVAEQFGSW